ncbi:MAG: carbohydrate-binding domain-containing protein [Eubacteriales bacterium]
MKSILKSKFITVIISVCLVIALFPITAMNISAAETITETLNMLNVSKNQTGEGYYWHNPSKTLTFSGLTIDTQSDFGLKLLDNTIIILEGKNVISAAKTAIYCTGTVTFKGTGSLTIISGNTGIIIKNDDRSKKMMILDGTINITAVNEAIRSDNASISIAGGNISLNTSDSTGYAINGRVVSISDGVTLSADNTIAASYSMTVNAANMTINAPKAAFEYKGSFDISNVSISAGTSATSLSAAEAYSGESSIITVSTAVERAPSIIFGADYPLTLDFIMLAGLLIIMLTVIFVPPYIKKRKVAAREATAAAQKNK